MYIAIDPRTCKECKAVFCYNCTLGACFEEGCCRTGLNCPMSRNECPVCGKNLYSRYEFQVRDERQMRNRELEAEFEANHRLMHGGGELGFGEHGGGEHGGGQP